MPRFAGAKREPGKLLRLIPKDIPRQSPSTDLILTVDRVSQTYIKYQENTAGTMVVPSCDVLNRRIGDVVPVVAELFDRAIWTAHRERRAVDITYAIGEHHRRAHVVVTNELVALNINAVEAARKVVGGGGK